MAYRLGLDIGIASVGWGMVNDDLNILHAGVRLFEEADKSENEKRRTKRGQRRRLRRKKHRLERINQLLQQYNIIDDLFDFHIEGEITPYHLRVKGLREKLTKEELAIALYHLGKRRGISQIEDVEGKDEDSTSTKEIVARNSRGLEDNYVCEVQLQRLEEIDSIRGTENQFRTSDYVREARKIIEMQQQFYACITEDFLQHYIDILKSKRAYYEGPGKGSQYGWENEREWMEGMMGHCTYFPEELRIAKHSHSAQLFNLLNDLNNLTVQREGQEKLTLEEKNQVIEQFKKVKASSLKHITSIIGVTSEEIKGFRIDKKEAPQFTALTTYHELKKILTKQQLEDVAMLDKIVDICTIYQTKSTKNEQLSQVFGDSLTEAQLEELSNLSYSGTHSLSRKAIYAIMEDLLQTSENQMQLFVAKGLKPQYVVNLEKDKPIPTAFVEEWILSPVVRRSMVQTIHVVNKVIEQYGYPKEITIELAREKNAAERKRHIEAVQKRNKQLNEDVKAIMKKENLPYEAFDMVKLMMLQDNKCLYSLRDIKISDIKYTPEKFEIDHIIPRSVSFDDSIQNKVLVYREDNQNKGNRTPYQYLSSGKGRITYQEFKAHIRSIKDGNKISKKKRGYLLEERNINRWDVQKEFINRNLVDTRYATSQMYKLLKMYFAMQDQEVKVKTMNGSFTSYLRKQWRFEKERDVDYKHHAEDALILTVASEIFNNVTAFQPINEWMIHESVDMETGEIISEDNYTQAFMHKYQVVNEIKNYEQYSYSHKSNKQPNRQLTNETIVSTREKDDKVVVIQNLKNLYDPKNKDVAKKIIKEYESLLMYHHDKRTYDKLRVVCEAYPDADNPLASYYQEYGQKVKKYAKKDNGPTIENLKYYGKQLGEHQDITYKYNDTRNKIVMLSVNTYRMDVYTNAVGHNKLVFIRYVHLKDKGTYYEIEKEQYDTLLSNRGIDETYSFAFSAYRKDVLEIDGNLVIVKGFSDEKSNRIETDYLNCRADKRIAPIITKKIVRKKSINILGKIYDSKAEKLKLKIQKA